MRVLEFAQTAPIVESGTLIITLVFPKRLIQNRNMEPAGALPFNFRTVQQILEGRLDSREARYRARLLIEDAPRMWRSLRLRCLSRTEQDVWPFYIFKNYKRPPPLRFALSRALEAVGYGLNWGDLATLSKAVKIARQFWGEQWRWEFHHRMASFHEHISTVEELWWLGLWNAPQHIKRECAYCAESWRTVDWQFEAQNVVVNLEVKYRPHDWLRFVNAELYASLLDAYFDGLDGKFPRKLAGQTNLVAMTLLGSFGPVLESRARAFLDAHPAIDGFLFWSIARRDTLRCEFVLRPGSDFVRSLVQDADEEDRWRNPFIVPAALPPATPANGHFTPLYGLLGQSQNVYQRHRFASGFRQTSRHE